jgi:hypothetical protein
MNMAAESSKLSDSQLAVLHNMIDGWELGCWSDSKPTIQKGGLGRGGSVRRVGRATVAALLKRDLIRHLGHSLLTRYKLTPAGRKAAKAAS